MTRLKKEKIKSLKDIPKEMIEIYDKFNKIELEEIDLVNKQVQNIKKKNLLEEF